MLRPAILGGLVSAVASIAVPLLLGAAQQWIPRWFGFLRIAYVRTAAATVGGLAAAAGISLSISDHSHKELTYIVWYGIAAFGFVVSFALTIVIDRRLMREAPAADATHRQAGSAGSGSPPVQPPLTQADRRRILRETEGRLAREIHDPTLRALEASNRATSEAKRTSGMTDWMVPLAPRHPGAALVQAMNRADQARQRKQALQGADELLRLILEAELRAETAPARANEMAYFNIASRAAAWARRVGSTDDVQKFSGNPKTDLPRLKVFVQTQLESCRDEWEQQ